MFIPEEPHEKNGSLTLKISAGTHISLTKSIKHKMQRHKTRCHYFKSFLGLYMEGKAAPQRISLTSDIPFYLFSKATRMRSPFPTVPTTRAGSFRTK